MDNALHRNDISDSALELIEPHLLLKGTSHGQFYTC